MANFKGNRVTSMDELRELRKIIRMYTEKNANMAYIAERTGFDVAYIYAISKANLRKEAQNA